LNITSNFFGKKYNKIMDDSKKNSNLLSLIDLFKYRPNHLTQFLLENNAFNDRFLEKLASLPLIEGTTNLQFNTIDDMKDYFQSLVDDTQKLDIIKNKKKMEEDLSFKIKEAIKNENYEEAAKIRDYMNKNNLKRK